MVEFVKGYPAAGLESQADCKLALYHNAKKFNDVFLKVVIIFSK